MLDVDVAAGVGGCAGVEGSWEIDVVGFVGDVICDEVYSGVGHESSCDSRGSSWFVSWFLRWSFDGFGLERLRLPFWFDGRDCARDIVSSFALVSSWRLS